MESVGSLAQVIFVVIAHELLIATALAVAINGIDDLLIDLIYFARRIWRSVAVYSRNRRATSADLHAIAPGRFALLIPAWDEAAVIRDMLRLALKRLDHPDYLLFVGAYPNDPATITAVGSIADPRIRLAIHHHNGPTTKADCLNLLWHAALAEERASGRLFTAIVLHDAEDVLHPAELKLFDALIHRFHLIQLPVLPLPDPQSRWISGSYIDEFAESHAKDLVVREALGASLPSAGVGCAIRRDALMRLAATRGGDPFDRHSLTEDYELGLHIGHAGGRSALVRIAGGVGQPVVCTREHFPATLDDAVRQKARWLTGIALAGWDRLGWRGGVAERYMRLRDRKAVFAALVTLGAYFAALLWLAVWLLTATSLLDDRFASYAVGGTFEMVMLFNSALLLWRLALRTGFTWSAHGWREAWRAAPRALVSNAIAILACLRAIRNYRRALRSGTPLAWDKTAHRFPALSEAD